MKTCNEPLSSDEQVVRDALQRVIDPEIGENIVDLGLVYGIAVEENTATVHLTMTTPACPMGEMILDDVHATLTRILPEGMEIDIHMVWMPPWEPSMISAEAKQRLGWA